MKRVLIILAIVAVASTTLISATTSLFGYIRASLQGEEIAIEWRTTDETGVYNFEIERKSEDVATFRRIGRLDARGGSNTYTFIDKSAFFKSESGKVYTYRLKTVGTGSEQYSPTVTVTHEVSGVRRSLGMIKELFR